VILTGCNIKSSTAACQPPNSLPSLSTLRTEAFRGFSWHQLLVQ